MQCFLCPGQSFHFSMVVKICLCLGIFFTYPVMLFPVIKIIENYFLPDANQKPCKGVSISCLSSLILPFSSSLFSFYGKSQNFKRSLKDLAILLFTEFMLTSPEHEKDGVHRQTFLMICDFADFFSVLES